MCLHHNYFVYYHDSYNSYTRHLSVGKSLLFCTVTTVDFLENEIKIQIIHYTDVLHHNYVYTHDSNKITADICQLARVCSLPSTSASFPVELQYLDNRITNKINMKICMYIIIIQIHIMRMCTMFLYVL